MLACISAFAACLLSMLLLRRIAPAIGLLDRPGGLKTHHGAVPVIGGLALLAGLCAASAVSAGPLFSGPFLPLAALLTFVGALDDRNNLSPFLRLAVHLFAGTMIVVSQGPMPGGPGMTLVAILAVATIINAFNLIDGVDGLAAGMGFIALLSFAGASPADSQALLVVVAAILAFLPFNLPTLRNRHIRCFLGDAGSTLIGFAVACAAIGVARNPETFAATPSLLWFAAIPLMDLGTSMLRRLAAGRSPFTGDAGHFHHRLLQAGASVRGTFLILLGMAAAYALAGSVLIEHGATPAVSLVLFAVSSAPAVFALQNPERLVRLLPRSLLRDVPVATTREGNIASQVAVDPLR